MARLEVVIGACFDERGWVLVQQRPAIASEEPNKWEFPGGKVESTDISREAALEREWQEELGLTVVVKRNRLIATAYGVPRKVHGHYDVYCYIVEPWHHDLLKTIIPYASQSVQFLPINEALLLPGVPAYRMFLEAVMLRGVGTEC